MNKDDPDKNLEDHVEGDNVDEEVDEDAQADEGVHLVGDDDQVLMITLTYLDMMSNMTNPKMSPHMNLPKSTTHP